MEKMQQNRRNLTVHQDHTLSFTYLASSHCRSYLKYFFFSGMVEILTSFEQRLGKLEETILPVYQVKWLLVK